MVEAHASGNHQDTLVAKNETIWQKQPPVSVRCHMKDVIRQTRGITSAVNSTSAKQAFESFITQIMIDLFVVKTN